MSLALAARPHRDLGPAPIRFETGYEPFEAQPRFEGLVTCCLSLASAPIRFDFARRPSGRPGFSDRSLPHTLITFVTAKCLCSTRRWRETLSEKDDLRQVCWTGFVSSESERGAGRRHTLHVAIHRVLRCLFASTGVFFFFSFVAGPRTSLSLKLIDTRVYMLASPHGGVRGVRSP